MAETLPATQYAVQLVGSDQLTLNKEKAVDRPGPYQIIARMEGVGLCFSDLKLLKQFSDHVRKGDIVKGVDSGVLSELPNYKPGDAPTVPGHEAVCTIVEVGDKVTRYTPGQRVLVQTDYRWLRTADSNAAFGYNLEGGLQEYVLMDERVIVDPANGDDFLIPVPDHLSGAAVALVEPWACVECSYVTDERNTLLAGGKLLIVADAGWSIEGVTESFSPDGKPAALALCGADPAQLAQAQGLDLPLTEVANLEDLVDEGYDDVCYFGSSKATLDILNDKLNTGAILNVILAGKSIGAPVSVGVGRVHYGLTRWVGTVGTNAAESYKHIPENGEFRDDDRAIVIGAGGPMGQMHTIRLVCAGKKDVSVTATDFDDVRLQALAAKTEELAQKLGVELKVINPQKQALEASYTYYAIMAPVGALVEQAVTNSEDKTLINVFAGIPSPIKHDLDLDTYIKNRCFMFGTSGSRLLDMKIVLDKAISGQLDTNCSVDAVSGMAGAISGIRAVENRTMAGKIIVYPALKELDLTPLSELPQKYPTVAEKLNNGIWTKEAEQELLKVAK